MRAMKRRKVFNGNHSLPNDRRIGSAQSPFSAAQQIKFAKMPVRTRAGSSPIRSMSIDEGPEVLVTSPSRRSTDGRLRRGSHGAVEAVKQRSRRDTATSSDLSSENELDASVFKRRQVKPRREVAKQSMLQEHHEAEERVQQGHTADAGGGSGEESEDTSLSSEFAEAADSGSMLDGVHDHLASSPLIALPPNQGGDSSPLRKARSVTSDTLQALPPPRPISTVLPVSALGQAIRARQSKPRNPLESFARLSGKGVPNPLNIRVYAPFSESSNRAFDMLLQRTIQNSDNAASPQVTVADAIGLSLWRYHEEGLKPPLAETKLDVNRWTLRIVDDGEVEYDFPALNRVTSMVDFTLNNNRPVRGRSKGKYYDEFALVEATEAQYNENRQLTPKYSKQFEELTQNLAVTNAPLQSIDRDTTEAIGSDAASPNPSIVRPFAFTPRKQSATLADKPGLPVLHSTPRKGPPKVLKIHLTSLEAHTQTETVEVTTDTYIAEVLDNVCKVWNLDKSHHFLKVSGTNTVAPLDRTVESIGDRIDLDLMRRRFAHDSGFGLTGSLGSSSPNAPLLLITEAPKKGKKSMPPIHSLAQNQDLLPNTVNCKKFTVVRKQPMSFTPSHQRTLLMDGDYMHILPGETGKTLFDTSAKTTTVPFSMIVGCKVSRRHPRTFRVIIFRERETKRYDFEAQTVGEAAEIVQEIRKGMELFHSEPDVLNL